MTKVFKRTLSIILCLIISLSSAVSITAGAVSTYPGNVTDEQVTAALKGTDKLLLNAVSELTGKGLKELVFSELYTDETVSGVLVSIYLSMGEEGTDLSYIGVDTSVQGVARSVSESYPLVSQALADCTDWSEVDVTSLSWGVSDKESFASAVGACFGPFDSLLYTLLCSGKMEIGSYIKIEGADGYENAVVPMLTALGCTDMISQARFTYYALKDSSNMVKNILLPVLTMMETSLESPIDNFTEILPTFAQFAVSGKFNEYMGVLLQPVTSNSLVNAMISLGVFSVDMDPQQMINDMLTGTSGQDGLKLAPIDLNALAACGSIEGGDFIPDKNKAYVEIMRWLVETIKLNGGEGSSASGALSSEDTDAIVATLISLFTPAEIAPAGTMIYPNMTPVAVTYTPNLDKDDLARALGETDALLDEFVALGGTYQSMNQLLSGAIYNNNNITALVKGVYGALEENGVTDMLALMGMDVSPAGVAASLASSGRHSTADTLYRYSTWADVQPGKVNWGVTTGSGSSFQSVLTAVLRPLAPALRMMLADEDLVIYDSIVINGADGYNTAVIPLLEALGCNGDTIKTYGAFKKGASGDGVITQLLNPVFDLIDSVCEKPVDTVTTILPNILYFLNSGSLEVCINNLMFPLTAITKNMSSLSGAVDMSSVAGEMDVEALVTDMLSGIDITLAELDIKSFADMGTPVKLTSKSVIDGKSPSYTYIKADREGIFLTLLRFVAETMQIPGNEDLLMGMMASDQSGAYASYTETFAGEISGKSRDELVEWLFNLFFKERIQATIVEEDEYVPDIIYKAPEKSYTRLVVLIVVICIGAIAAGAVFVGQKQKKKRARS